MLVCPDEIDSSYVALFTGERLRKLPHGNIALELVIDFMASCGLQRSLCVLVPEAGLSEDDVDRKRLREKMGLMSSQNGPVLCDLLTQLEAVSCTKGGGHTKTEEEYDEEDFEEEEDDAAVSGENRRPRDLSNDETDDIVSELDCEELLNETAELSIQNSLELPSAMPQQRDASSSFLDDHESSLNDRVEFSVRMYNVTATRCYSPQAHHITFVEGSHVLDDQNDLVENIDTP